MAREPSRGRVTIAAAILLGYPALAADPEVTAATPRVVALDEAIHAAETAPDVVMARAAEAAAAANAHSVRLPAESTLSLATRSQTARESASISVPFRWGGQRGKAVKAAEADQQTAGRERAAAQVEAVRACRVAWYTLAAAEDFLRAASDRADRAEQNRKAITDQFEVQRVARLDVARASADAASATAARAGAENDVMKASAELGALLGVSGTRLSAGGDRPLPPDVESIVDLTRRAREASPDLLVAQSELAAAEARVVQRERERLPGLALEAGADFNDPTLPGTDYWGGVAIVLPTRSGATLEAARADRDRSAAKLESARRRTDADVASAWSAADAAKARFSALDQVARPAAEEAAELTRIGYTEGKLDLFRLLDAERALADARRESADAYREWGIAYANLERLVTAGTP